VSRRRKTARVNDRRATREDVTPEKVAELRASGMTMQAIADQFGVAINLIQRRLKKAGATRIPDKVIELWRRRQSESASRRARRRGDAAESA
jgi:hypothetical protein